MKSITHSLNGLASSLLLNVGLTQVAQKFDPVSAAKCNVSRDTRSSEMSNVPCHFTPQKGQ